MLQPQTSVDGAPQNSQNGSARWPSHLLTWRPWRRQAPTTEFERAYQRFLDSVKETLSDFTTLEVNSVLVRNISADHPLTDVDFARQIAEDLYEWFAENPTDKGAQRTIDPVCLGHLEYLSKHLAFPLSEPDRDRLKAIQTDSSQCLGHQPANGDQPIEPGNSPRSPAGKAPEPAEYRRFLRYLQKFALLCECNKWDTDGMLHGREQQQLRKLWELVGTSFVYAQTVVGLDGDAVSRINEQLFRSPQGLSREMIEALIRFHYQNAEASARGRNNLMAIIVETFQAMLRR
jgi:hypothetical protein